MMIFVDFHHSNFIISMLLIIVCIRKSVVFLIRHIYKLYTKVCLHNYVDTNANRTLVLKLISWGTNIAEIMISVVEFILHRCSMYNRLSTC